MSENERRKGAQDPEVLAAELKTLDEVSERVRLAGLALAVPFADLRRGQLEREAARTAARRGPDDPETLARRGALERSQARFAQLKTELVQARVTPLTAKEGEAAISGVVVRGGEPVVDATVALFASNERTAFVCTNAAGGFALAAPAGQPLVLSVTPKEGGEAFRDRTEVTLKAGQTVFRHIDLDGAGAPCAEPPPAPPPADDSFPMVRLVGQLEADARKLIAAQNLVLGERSEKPDPDQAGRVIDQSPAAGTKVKTGAAVSIVVATDGRVDVPQVLGLTRDDARLVLAKADLTEGRIGRTEAAPELKDRVVSQEPKPGDRVALKSAVDLVIGTSRASGPAPRLDADVARVASLASHRLGETASTPEAPVLAERLAAAKVARMADLDRLIGGDREAARKALGLRTLADTDRVLAALRQARKELGG